jgi:His-Xaa-Ser system radical SAM maturase HxsC
MLVKLSGRGLRPLCQSSASPFVGRICERPDYPEAARHREILLVREGVERLPRGFRAYLLTDEAAEPADRDTYLLPSDQRHLVSGDVVRIDPAHRALATLYRRTSPSNTFLVTERCDNYCVMCSQPPKERDDLWLVDELEEVIPLIDPDTREIGITGGEPALLGDRLVELLLRLKQYLPRTGIHVLSNGRRFGDADFARKVASVGHPDLMFGIPLYSDLAEDHDYVVQAKGAFDDTVRGILNLKRAHVRVELRFVIHAETYARLPEFATFVARNLRFVNHVALMGLELMGFGRANVDSLWIDPLDYQGQLASAVHTLDRAGLRTSIYNHQLCVLDRSLRPFARKSISDWKNLYFDECEGCRLKETCGGFFASSTLRKSRGVRAVATPGGDGTV